MTIDDEFFYRLHQAEEAGLNKEAALQVAYLEISLEDALGCMDMDYESLACNDLSDDVDCSCGGLGDCPDCFPF